MAFLDPQDSNLVQLDLQVLVTNKINDIKREVTLSEVASTVNALFMLCFCIYQPAMLFYQHFYFEANKCDPFVFYLTSLHLGLRFIVANDKVVLSKVVGSNPDPQYLIINLVKHAALCFNKI